MAISNLTTQYISASFQNLMQVSSSGELFDGLGTQITILDVDNINVDSLTVSNITASITTVSGNSTVEGDLTVFGTLTAKQFVVSSSIINETTIDVSGSTKFGNSLDDTHEYTGSLSVTGSASFYGNVVITGSLTVTSSNTFTNYGPTILYGPVTITGTVSSSASITGSLFGTASYANQALSSSFASNTTQALSSSFANNATSASYSNYSLSSSFSVNSVSASYAVTASYALNTVQINTGSFATTGSNIFKGGQTIDDGNVFQLRTAAVTSNDSICTTTFVIQNGLSGGETIISSTSSTCAQFVKYFLVSINTPGSKFRAGTLIIADGYSQSSQGQGSISDITTSGIGDTSGFTFFMNNDSDIQTVITDSDSYRIHMEITRMEIPAV